MNHYSYKEIKNRSKELAHFLSKRNKSNLLFEHIELDNGYFEGYTIEGEPFFGELLLGDNYSFGLFDKNGLYYGIRSSKDKPLQYGDGYNGSVIIFDETKKDNERVSAHKLKRGLVGDEISHGRCESPLFSALYLKGEDGYLKRFLPSNIECARFLKAKNECFFGAANQTSPTGYGVYIDIEHHIFAFGNISSFGKNTFTLADDSPAIGYFDNRLHIMYKKLILSFYDDGDNSIIKIAKRPIPCSRGCACVLSLNTFPSITIKKDKNKELISVSEQYGKYEQSDYSKTDKSSSNFFFVEECLLPVQFGLSLIDRLYKGDTSLIMKVFDRIDSSLLATSKKDIESYLVKGEFDEETFIRHVSTVHKERIKKQKEIEQKQKEAEKKIREEKRKINAEKRKRREEEQRRREEEWLRNQRAAQKAYEERRRKEASAPPTYNPGAFESNMELDRLGWLSQSRCYDFIKQACPIIVGKLDFNHVHINVDINDNNKTVTGTVNVSACKVIGPDEAKQLQQGFMAKMEKAGVRRYLPGYSVSVVVEYKGLTKL